MTAGCMVKKAEEIINSFLNGHSYCHICRRSFFEILRILKAIAEGESPPDPISTMGRLAGDVINSCRCGGGKPVAEKFSTLLQENGGEFAAHIEKRVCPSSRCSPLILPPCQAGCPAGIDIPGYIALAGSGQYEEALELIREYVPLPGTLGRVCAHPCTSHCTRGRVDTPVAICSVKRLAYDRAALGKAKPPAKPERKYVEKIAVVGSGPAGLSAAYFLTRRGYAVTVFEAMPEAGGMLAYGIPPYRLPREVLKNEISRIEAMGVEFRLNNPISPTYGLEDLKKDGYAAIFLGTGAWEGSRPGIPGLDKLAGIYDGVTFLKEVNEWLLKHAGAEPVHLAGKEVVVVGGGNVAVDAARVCLRLGAREVKIIYRRTREEMPALRQEIEDALKEGIMLDCLISPVNVGGEHGLVKYIECVRNTLGEPGGGGRRSPVPVKNSEHKIQAGLVIFATGQRPVLTYIGGKHFSALVDVDKNRIMIKNPLTMETFLPGVFAGGDAVTGPAAVISAIADAKRAAAGMHAYLRGEVLLTDENKEKKKRTRPVITATGGEKARPCLIDRHGLYLEERKNTFAEIEQNIGEEAAHAEALRCLGCDICIACGRCVEICRDKIGINAIQLGYIGSCDVQRSDFTRPEDRCIGCGACAENCPTGAITVEDKDGFREMRMCGTLMSRLKLARCRVCGQTFATERHLAFINAKIRDCYGYEPGHQICPACAPKVQAENACGVTSL